MCSALCHVVSHSHSNVLPLRIAVVFSFTFPNRSIPVRNLSELCNRPSRDSGFNAEAVALIHTDRVVWFTWPSPPHPFCRVDTTFCAVNSSIQTVDLLHSPSVWGQGVSLDVFVRPYYLCCFTRMRNVNLSWQSAEASLGSDRRKHAIQV